MAYFTAVIARAGGKWRARDVEVDDAESLDDLADALRLSAVGEEPVLAVIEHEDEWFALIRVDGDDEPRLFVSDLGASTQGHYAPLLAPAGDVDVDLEGEDGGGPDEGAGGDAAGDGAAGDAEIVVAAWAGDVDLLDDLGISSRTLRKLTEEKGDDPGAVLAEIGETAGFAELLEALR